MAKPKAIVRLMREEDMPALVEIDGMASGSPRPDYIQGKVRAALDSKHSLVISLVAEVENRVVGFLMGAVYRGEFGIPEEVARVDTMGVHPKHQDQGIGRQLMEEFIAHSRKAGIGRIRTLVDWDRQWELMGFFRSAGFSPAGTSIVLERTV